MGDGGFLEKLGNRKIGTRERKNVPKTTATMVKAKAACTKIKKNSSYQKKNPKRQGKDTVRPQDLESLHEEKNPLGGGG